MAFMGLLEGEELTDRCLLSKRHAVTSPSSRLAFQRHSSTGHAGTVTVGRIATRE
jgi:hypothetical protein